MDTILVSLFAAVMLIVSTLVMIGTSLVSVNKISDSFQTLEQRISFYQQSGIDARFSYFQSGRLVIDVDNVGQVDLADVARWSVLVERPTGSIIYMTYDPANPPPADGWTVGGYYLSEGQPELFDPGIFNPGETARVILSLAQPLEPGETVRVTFMTSAGTKAQCLVTEPG